MIAFLLVLLSCSNEYQTSFKEKQNVFLQPFTGIPASTIQRLCEQLRIALGDAMLITVLPEKQIPESAFYPPRNRYRADSLIRYLQHTIPEEDVVIGIKHHDISTTKKQIPDYGVMGLGFQPGKSCVVSTFRLRKNNLDEELFKVAIHEWGHTRGLPHCSKPDCFMRDAQGGNPLKEEHKFCSSCLGKLSNKGYLITLKHESVH